MKRQSFWIASLTLALSLFGATASFAADSTQNPVAKASGDAAIQTFTLSNGMQLIIKADHRAPTAVHMVWVRVGSVDEVDGASGIAHVLEHMMFKGTKSLSPGEFSRRVAALGGRENAFTSKDYTAYFQQIPAHHLPDVMQLESERFATNNWSDEEFRKEIEVIKEERRMRTDDVPRAALHEQMSAIQFIASSYRRPIIGWMNDLDHLGPQEVRLFFKRWYTPANAAVVVVGDVDSHKVLTWAEKYYGAIPANQDLPERKPRSEPEQHGKRHLVFKAPAEQAYLMLSWKVPGFKSFDPSQDHRDALALTVLAAVLDGYSGARLDKNLTQGAQRVADAAGAANGFSGRGPQTFVLEGVPAPGKSLQELENALRSEIEKIAQDGISEAELKRVKAQWLAQSVYGRDSLFNQAREIGSYWIEGLPVDTSDRLMLAMRTISVADVQSVARKYFGDDNLTVAELQPLPIAAKTKSNLKP